ncbi:hypothetical protein PLICRDRAFT_627328 [Plicaturopsis crispa FD-325 SS-3]|nr:hypothetical protein PLICRDRAFT_627328 [Plicaturopsis crispa FD-325 SS-3]
MCHWRRVGHIYKRCNHMYQLPEEMIQCDDRYCKFSTSHPSNCVPPKCTQTCWQYRQAPQSYTRHIDNWCPNCLQAAADAAAGQGGGSGDYRK